MNRSQKLFAGFIAGVLVLAGLLYAGTVTQAGHHDLSSEAVRTSQ